LIMLEPLSPLLIDQGNSPFTMLLLALGQISLSLVCL
jgi:hypothetical protein